MTDLSIYFSSFFVLFLTRFDENGIAPSVDKIRCFLDCRRPKTTAKVRSFLWLVTYVSQFIPDLATLTFPSRALAKNKAEFKWTEEEQGVF